MSNYMTYMSMVLRSTRIMISVPSIVGSYFSTNIPWTNCTVYNKTKGYLGKLYTQKTNANNENLPPALTRETCSFASVINVPDMLTWYCTRKIWKRATEGLRGVSEGYVFWPVTLLQPANVTGSNHAA